MSIDQPIKIVDIFFWKLKFRSKIYSNTSVNDDPPLVSQFNQYEVEGDLNKKSELRLYFQRTTGFWTESATDLGFFFVFFFFFFCTPPPLPCAICVGTYCPLTFGAFVVEKHDWLFQSQTANSIFFFFLRTKVKISKWNVKCCVSGSSLNFFSFFLFIFYFKSVAKIENKNPNIINIFLPFTYYFFCWSRYLFDRHLFIFYHLSNTIMVEYICF